ncbi:MAG TPA: TetR/AcrR family transcriptional regulator [Thermomicrobiales bacterium]|jgi:AcrR family transcriptional regulator|nr:TetR/AcrR family transcriptional regulator [Thermomicrobiales bacterium]
MGGQPATKLTPRGRVKRERIREAARQLFLERGFAGTSIDAVTVAAGVSKPTVYRYFANKEALFADIVQGMTVGGVAGDTSTNQAALAFASHAEFTAVLTDLARQIITHHLTDPTFLPLLRMLIAEAPRFPQLTAVYREIVIDWGLRNLAMLFTQARERGLIATPDADLAAQLFISTVLFFMLKNGLLTTGPPQLPPDETVARLVQLVVTAVE